MNQDLAKQFKALGNIKRLAILSRLSKGEQCSCTLLKGTDISQPTMSHHLETLSKAGLISSYKEGTWKKHHINEMTIDEMISFLVSLKQEIK
ncbi:MAG TPA: transcriptional regulator [Firmicutes bacterium]|jgi:ArsR family transcriptional regulator|nr:transcriptional regulator [Bacillota bacterium]